MGTETRRRWKCRPPTMRSSRGATRSPRRCARSCPAKRSSSPSPSAAPMRATGSPPIASRRSSSCCPRPSRRSRRSCAIARPRAIKVVPRGAGTSLSGGALPLADGVLLGMAKFNRILEIDYANRCVVVQPGRHQSRHHARGRGRRLLLRARPVEPDRLHDRRQCRGEFRRRALPQIRPDHQQPARHRNRADRRRDRPPRRQASRRRRLRSARRHDRVRGPARASSPRSPCASCKKPPTARALLIGFAATEDAGNCVAAIIGAGIIPGGMEMMDRPAIHAAEDFVHAGYPLDVEALLIVELDGPAAEVDHLIDEVEAIARANRAVSLRVSQQRGRAPRRSGPGARRRSRRSAASRPIITAWTAPSRAAAWPRCWRELRELSAQSRAARRQRVPCRRRQPASADPLRRQPAGRDRAGRGIRRRYPAALRRGRRRA